MVNKPRLSVRKLMIWIAVIAALLALGRYPYIFIQAQMRFSARSREGDALVRSYYAQCPTGIGKTNWDDAVNCVQIAWCNVVFSPFHFPDENSLERILDQMRGLAARATPADAEGDIYLILDLLAHARTKAGPAYLSHRRAGVKRALWGYGQPSPTAVDYALRWVGRRPGKATLATVAQGLRATDWRLRVACCRALGQFGLGLGSRNEADAALTKLMHALENDDPLVREIAIECFHEMGPKAARGRDALVHTLRSDRSDRARWQAARTMPQVEKEAKLIVPALIAALGDDDSEVRVMAISSLGELGEKAKDALPALHKALLDSSYAVRRTAVEVLVKVGSSSDAVVRSLIDVLQTDPEGQVREVAARVLGEIGPGAVDAGPPLIDALKRDEDGPVRAEAAEAIVLVGPADSTLAAILARVLRKDKVGYVRAAAARALGQIGSPAACGVDDLINATKDQDDSVWTAASEALGKIGPEARRSIPALIRLLTAVDTRTQQAAIDSLTTFGPAARMAEAAIRALRDAPPDKVIPDIRVAAATALAKISSPP